MRTHLRNEKKTGKNYFQLETESETNNTEIKF